MAHSDLHKDIEWLKNEMELNDGEKVTRRMKETQAEAVAYMTASTFGIETEHKSFDYIATWSSGRDLKDLEKSLNVIYTESQKLLKEIEAEFDSRGLTMGFEPKDKTPLTEEQKLPLVKEMKTFALDNMRFNNELQKSALEELKTSEFEKEKTILKEQIALTVKIDEKLKGLDEKISLYEKAESREEQTRLELQMKADVSQVQSMHKTVDELSHERIDIMHEEAKEDLRLMFHAEPLKALKQMKKEIPQMKDLTVKDLKLMAKSIFIAKNYAELIGKDNERFAEYSMKQLDNLKSAMSKNGCVVEIGTCEQWTDEPIFEEGTVAHPKEANKRIATAEKQIRALKKEAESKGEYFPYAKCSVNVMTVSGKDAVTSFKDRVDIGDGTQKDLADVLSQSCSKSSVYEQFASSMRERSNVKILTPVWEHEEYKEQEQKGNVEEHSLSMNEWKKEISRDREKGAGLDEKDEIVVECDKEKE